MRINLAPLLDNVMHQVLIMRYAPIMHRAFSVGEEEGWNKRHIGIVVWWFNFFLDLINCFVSFSFSGSRQWTFMLSDSSGV